MCILRQRRRLGPPCLRVQRENSPPDCCLIRLTPLTFALRFDAGAVYQEIERASATLIGQAHVQRLLAAAQGAIVGHCPVQSNQPQKALHEPGRLPKRHPEQHFQRQASLDRIRRGNGPPDRFLILLIR